MASHGHDTSRRMRSALCAIAAGRPAAELRHLLYLRVRSYLGAGWTSLPDGLSADDIRDLASMACSRRDRTMQQLCRQTRAATATAVAAIADPRTPSQARVDPR